MAQNDADAAVAIGACRLLGREPHRDVAVVGYDNYLDAPTRSFEPVRALATVDKRNADIGRRAISLLLDPPPAGDVERLEPRLVVRD